MAYRVELFGVDITQRVMSWGSVEQVKDLLLADAALFTDKIQIVLDNYDEGLSPGGTRSLVSGVRWNDKTLAIYLDETQVFEGYVVDVKADRGSRSVEIEAENVLKLGAESDFSGSASNTDPGSAMLSILRKGLSEDQIDAASFHISASGAKLNSAHISYLYDEEKPTKIMAAVQAIAELCSISVFVYGGKVVARAYYPYQGNESGLKFDIDDSNVVRWGSKMSDNFRFFNKVIVGYPTEQVLELEDVQSIKLNNVTRTRTISDGDEKAGSCWPSDAVSAAYFGRLTLQRSAYRRDIVDVLMPADSRWLVIGERFKVTSGALGLNAEPMEAYEVHPSPEINRIGLKLAGLRQSAA